MYDTIPTPWRKDFLIMDFVMSKGASKGELLNIVRVRGFLCTMFMSVIVASDGTYLEDFSIVRPTRPP